MLDLFAVSPTLLILFSGCTPEQKPVQLEVKKPAIPEQTGPDWQIQWDKTVTAAKKEGKVVLYGAYGLVQARDPFVRAIREKFGIALEMTTARGGEVAARLTSERGAGLYLADVHMGGSDTIVDLIDKKFLDPIETYLILPEVKEPSAWFGGTLPIWDSQRYAFGSIAFIDSRTAINTNLVRFEELTSWKDLLKPKLKDKMVMADPTISGGGNAFTFTAIRLMGLDYIKELIKQDPMITRDLRLMNEWVTRGKYLLGLGASATEVRAMNKEGAPISMVPVLKEGTDLGQAAGNVVVINKNPHPAATKVFVNWVLSKEGQSLFSRAAGWASKRLDVPTDHLEPWRVPDPNIKYIILREEDITREKHKSFELYRELFAPALR